MLPSVVILYYERCRFHIHDFVESRNRYILTEDSEIVKIWIEYYKKLYHYPINPDENILNYDRCE